MPSLLSGTTQPPSAVTRTVPTCRHRIKRIADDYIRLIKYGDSLYRCKQLKRASLGRMCKMKPSLDYLEEVRKHLARRPSIDPSTRTLLICGELSPLPALRRTRRCWLMNF